MYKRSGALGHLDHDEMTDSGRNLTKLLTAVFVI